MRSLPKPLWQILNLLFLAATIVANGLANGQLVPGKSIGGISATYNTLFAPAGITFSIWGIIYLLFIVFGVYQARDLFRRSKADDPWLSAISPLFIASCLFNIAWLFAWLNEVIGLSLLLMLGLLLSLAAIYFRLRSQPNRSAGFRYCVQLLFSLYVAWINVAFIANTSSWLTGLGWQGGDLGPLPWTIFAVIAAGAVGSLVVSTQRDIAFGLVIIWALLGIILKHQALDTSTSGPIQTTAWIAIGAVILIAAISLIGHRRALAKLQES